MLPILYAGNGSDLDCSQNNYNFMKLLPHLKTIIKNEQTKLNDNYIAIHVRRTDIIATYKAHNEKYIANYDIYDNFIKENASNNLYIATDNEDSYKHFTSKYKNHTINNNTTFIKTENRRKTSLKDAIIDLYMCIDSISFLGTKLSSFTDFIECNRNSILS